MEIIQDFSVIFHIVINSIKKWLGRQVSLFIYSWILICFFSHLNRKLKLKINKV